MEDVNGKILYQGYGLKLLNTTRNRTGFVCKTDRGYKEVKKNNVDENAIIFESQAKEHLARHGFCNLTNFNKTIDNKPFYLFEGNRYVVEDYITTQSIDLSSRDNILEAVRTLAEMHKASCGFHSEIKNTNIGRLPAIYEKRNNELVRIKKWIGSQSNLSKVDLIVLKNYDYFKRKAAQSFEMLQNSHYNRLMEQAVEVQSFCHNAYKGDNIRLMETGNLFVAGFQKCAYDTCIVDLAEFIRRYMKNEDCSINVISDMIEEYNKMKTVTNEDRELLFAMLAYPYKFLKICNEYYNRRRVYVSDGVVQKLENCVAQSERNDKILNQLQNS